MSDLIDATSPTDGDLASTIPLRIRETREAVNTCWASLGASGMTPVYNSKSVSDTITTFGVEGAIIETIALTGTATGASLLTHMTGAREGCIVIISARDDNVTIKHNAGSIEMTDSADISLQSGDFVFFINEGGDPDVPDNGVWKELIRSLAP